MAKGRGKRVKVKLRDIEDNPFRNFKFYPINKEKVSRLVDSITATTFWENLLGRVKGSKVEIAYGHHRIAAARDVFPPDYEIEILVRELSDADMIKVMSAENDEKYNCSPAAIDNDVNATRQYLDVHPDEEMEIKERLTSGMPEYKKLVMRLRGGAPLIAEFLHRSPDAVEKSIERLNSIKFGIADIEALHLMPSARAADNFINAIKKIGIKKERQRELAEKIVNEKLYNAEQMIKAVRELLPKAAKPKQAGSEARLFKSVQLIQQLSDFLDEFSQSISDEDKIFLDSIWAFNHSQVQLESSLVKAKDALKKAKKSETISFREFQRILRLLYPFTEKSELTSCTRGVGIDQERKAMIACRHSGGMVYPLDELPTKETVIIPRAVVHNLLVLNSKSNWDGIKKEQKGFAYHIGRTRLGHQPMAYPAYSLPNFDEVKYCSIDASFRNNLLEISHFICTNAFLCNLFGLFVGKDAIYVCDNRRSIRKRCTVPRQFTNVLLYPEIVKMFKKYNETINEVGISGSMIFFLGDPYHVFMHRGKGNFHKIERLFQRAERGNGVKVQVTSPSEDLYRVWRYAKKFPSNVVVVCEGKNMRYLDSIPSGVSEFNLEVSPVLKRKIEFNVDGKLFSEALYQHRNLKIGKDWILFHNEDRSSSCLLALEDKNKLQLVLYENEEYLAPLELRAIYGLKLKRGERLYKLHRLDTVPKLLSKGDIRYMKGATPPERFSVSLRP